MFNQILKNDLMSVNVPGKLVWLDANIMWNNFKVVCMCKNKQKNLGLNESLNLKTTNILNQWLSTFVVK